MRWAPDAADFQTWEELLVELEALIEGREGLSVSTLAQMGDDQWTDPPQGFIDVSRLLSAPSPIVIPMATMSEIDTTQRVPVERLLRDLFADAYCDSMPPSPLAARWARFEENNASGMWTYLYLSGWVVWFV